MRPAISIIVPVYNTEKYICRCVDSILSQSFTDFELILVDDGSTDNCSAICDEYAAKDSRVRAIHQTNQGVSSARNKGVDMSTGECICFIDSDDIIHPVYCETLYNVLKSTTCDFSACATLRFFHEEELNGTEVDSEIFIQSNLDFFLGQLDRKSEIGPCNKLFRKTALYNIKFIKERRYEDVRFSVDLVRNLHNGVVYTSRELYFYRQQPNGFMATQSASKMDDFLNAGEYLLLTAYKYFPEHKAKCLKYVVSYPWCFIDPIYVKREFKNYKSFLSATKKLLCEYIDDCGNLDVFGGIQLMRMKLFSKSMILYGFNAYARLFRVYLYRLLGKDAYKDGHGI